jgi:hypothetical protein
MGQEVSDVSGKKIMDVLHKLYSDYMGDDTEKMAVFTDDGQMTVFSSRDADRINISLADIIRTLAHRGKNITNITAMVHNHNRGQLLSPEDMEIYKKLTSVGFKGLYQVYDPGRRRLTTAKLPEK